MHIESVVEQLRAMRLSTMADSFAARMSNANNNDLTPEEFFALLVEDEYNARKNRKLARMIGHANFKPEQACIENIIYNQGRGFQKKDIMPLTTQSWINNAQNVLICGPTGSGKTYLVEPSDCGHAVWAFTSRKYATRYSLKKSGPQKEPDCISNT